MDLSLTHTRLLVDDFAASWRFYREVVGLEPVFPGEAGPYAEFRTGPATLAIFDRRKMDTMLGRPATSAAGSSAGSGGVVLTFAVADVDAAFVELTGRGARFVAPPFDYPPAFLRMAHFADPDGHLLEINARMRGTLV